MTKPPRIKVKSLADAMKQLRVALTELAATQSRFSEMREAYGVADAQRHKALDDAKAARAEHADLKKRLHDAELENARMSGYLDRVREDDVVREELVKTGDVEGGGITLLPKRKIKPWTEYGEGSQRTFDRYGNPEPKPKHWVNY